MLDLLERLFSVNQRTSTGIPSVIVAISYGAGKRKLTRSSCAVVTEALSIHMWKGRVSPILWCDFAHNPSGSTEKTKKRNILKEAPNFYAGKVTSTTDECEAIIKTAKENDISLDNIVVVAWSSHSRRARLVWKYYLPNSQIAFKAVSGEAGNDPQNPMKLQRSWKTWLLVNMVMFPFYKFFPGVGWFAKRNFHQPT